MLNRLFGEGISVELDNGMSFITQEDKPTVILLYAILEKLEEIRCGLIDIENNTETPVGL